MSIRNKLVIGSLSFLASVALAGSATAACMGSTCSLGGQLRAQIGNGLPIPITLAAAPGGASTRTPNGTPAADLRWGQPGGIKATGNATVMQQSPAPVGTPGTAPRSLMFSKAGLFTYDNNGPVGIGVIKFNAKVMSVKTNILLTNPHPGYTSMGATTPSGPFPTKNGPNTLQAGGRPGPQLTPLTWCVGMPFTTVSANPGCLNASKFGTVITTTTNDAMNATMGPVNGLIRYVPLKNQFGGLGQGGRTLGTAMVYFNGGGLAVNDLPCIYDPVIVDPNSNPKKNPNCFVGISQVTPGTRGVNGQGFGARVSNNAFSTPTGFFTAQLGANGTVIHHGTKAMGVITEDGAPKPFTGQFATSWGVPGTTGRLEISVTKNEDALLGGKQEIFIRTGGDNRTAGGQGIVVSVAGAISQRNISGPNGNRGWSTFNVPEPSAIFAASAGLLALLGCHQLARRRNR
jgi:hypothetical protein